MLEKPVEGKGQAIIALKSLVDEHLKDLVAGMNLNLRHQIEYALLSPGKRLRPIMLLLSTQAVGGQIERNLPLALSLEALHAATLVHDDIIDQDQFRRGVPTVQRRWSVGTAILVPNTLATVFGSSAFDLKSKDIGWYVALLVISTVVATALVYWWVKRQGWIPRKVD